ncbi:hypothetical protein MBM_02763 [Drepanopeziza brunnea f. sp. 'multigermtubi' MB_m1]|uniref:Uncharacterized protein n=1 Tax=Marssonina brunnea f. sp. multigermtubi (strain MB_m1) TaxID=1072389 RepID=K1X2S5_MARBU|nr:uncharacterized protein MBM_02763 [Drepanopeziza brunnea f. sp. 'multigermtubi' MB_m1]EKD19526.1 hypothetical protein MBM_02763 [Drepanopeziza brunnea f. sp. 'multigermtubi' MB_m1]
MALGGINPNRFEIDRKKTENGIPPSRQLCRHDTQDRGAHQAMQNEQQGHETEGSFLAHRVFHSFHSLHSFRSLLAHVHAGVEATDRLDKAEPGEHVSPAGRPRRAVGRPRGEVSASPASSSSSSSSSVGGTLEGGSRGALFPGI